MAHPFSKLFDAALRRSSRMDNAVLEEAEQLYKKGYSAEEIHSVLLNMQKQLIREEDHEVVKEAAEQMSRYL